jgi:AcrR family transcriptional regulator
MVFHSVRMAPGSMMKSLLYTYFGNEEALFDSVFNSLVAEMVPAIPIDTTDLAEYAGRLFDPLRDAPRDCAPGPVGSARALGKRHAGCRSGGREPGQARRPERRASMRSTVTSIVARLVK